MRLGVFDTLNRDYYMYGTARFLVTDTRDEFSIQRINPNAIVEVYYEDF